MERQELEYKFEQLMRERHKWYFKYVSSHNEIGPPSLPTPIKNKKNSHTQKVQIIKSLIFI